MACMPRYVSAVRRTTCSSSSRDVQKIGMCDRNVNTESDEISDGKMEGRDEAQKMTD